MARKVFHVCLLLLAASNSERVIYSGLVKGGVGFKNNLMEMTVLILFVRVESLIESSRLELC